MKGQIESLSEKISLKIDSSNAQLESRLLRWFLGTIITLSAIIVAAIKFIPSIIHG